MDLKKELKNGKNNVNSKENIRITAGIDLIKKIIIGAFHIFLSYQ